MIIIIIIIIIINIDCQTIRMLPRRCRRAASAARSAIWWWWWAPRAAAAAPCARRCCRRASARARQMMMMRATPMLFMRQRLITRARAPMITDWLRCRRKNRDAAMLPLKYAAAAVTPSIIYLAAAATPLWYLRHYAPRFSPLFIAPDNAIH